MFFLILPYLTSTMTEEKLVYSVRNCIYLTDEKTEAEGNFAAAGVSGLADRGCIPPWPGSPCAVFGCQGDRPALDCSLLVFFFFFFLTNSSKCIQYWTFCVMFELFQSSWERGRGQGQVSTLAPFKAGLLLSPVIYWLPTYFTRESFHHSMGEKSQDSMNERKQ